MSFIKRAVKGVFGGGLLGLGLNALFGGGKKKQPAALPKPATRDDAVVLAERDAELARRRGASADRVTGASGEPSGGFGRFIVGS